MQKKQRGTPTSPVTMKMSSKYAAAQDYKNNMDEQEVAKMGYRCCRKA
jgi:hypothetical protein